MRQRLGRLAAYRSALGRRYVLALLVRSLADRALLPLDSYLLRVEGRRGMLGPAHRAYRGHNALENQQQWSRYDWSGGGEEWGPPEGRRALVEEHLAPRLGPDPVIVEIGPGAGRWSAELLPLAARLILVDTTEEAIELCRRRFGEAVAGSGGAGSGGAGSAGAGAVELIRTDGASLPGVASGSADLVFSMEAFVHMAPVDVAAYVTEMARVLRPGGFALIHHAGRYHRAGWRAPMTGELFAALASERGLRVEAQFDSWGEGFNVHASHDLITVLRR